MYTPSLAIAFFNGTYDYQHSAYAIYRLVWYFVDLDMYELGLETNPPIPPLYESGVKYEIRKDENGEEIDDHWQDIFTVMSHKAGVCENLVAWRVAELRMKGIEADVHVTQWLMPNGDSKYHIRVQWPNGYIEDPSKILGMKDAI